MTQENEIPKRAKSEIDLRKLMRKLGMGSNAFAEACGVSSQSMAQFLRPGKSLTTATIYRIANALDIDPREMFFPTEENNGQDASVFAEDSAVSNQDEDTKTETSEPQTIHTTTFCPHCGTKVRVGVVLLSE